ncbi:Protein kinase domain, partial [Trinorchestia longiramus]
MHCGQSLNNLTSDNVKDYKVEGLLNTIWDGRGRVVSARHVPSDTPVAIKIFDLEKCADDLDLIQHEARTLRELRHPHICAVGVSLSFGQEAWLVLPHFQCSAEALICTHFTLGLPELALALVARDVLLALQYLHSRCIIHRAVQSRHILISSTGRCALSGLRHSIEHRVGSGEGDTLHDYPRYPVALLNWASPEMLHQ